MPAGRMCQEFRLWQYRRTILDENRFQGEWLSANSTTPNGNSFRSAKKHAEYLSERRGMLRYWAHYSENTASGNEPRDR